MSQPDAVLSALPQLDPFTRLISGLVTTELHDLFIYCEPQEFSTFSPPAGQTCQQWASSFVQAVGGYIDNPDATADCRYCQYRVGDDFLRGLNISFDDRWRDLGVSLILFATRMGNGPSPSSQRLTDPAASLSLLQTLRSSCAILLLI